MPPRPDERLLRGFLRCLPVLQDRQRHPEHAVLEAARGIGLSVRVSVPGPATVRRLRAIAYRCGVAVTAPVAGDYGFSLTEPTATGGPDRFIWTPASGYDPRLHGEVRLHFNALGGFTATAEWISRFRAA